MLDDDLGAAEDMPGRYQANRCVADGDFLAIAGRLGGADFGGAVAGFHDGNGFAGCQHVTVAGPGVVTVAVGDDGAVDPSGRVDIEIAGPAVQTGRPDLDPRSGMRAGM